MSVSPIASYMLSMYVPSSVTDKKKAEEIDYEYQAIMQELALYGLSPSGDKDTDKIRLQTAQYIEEWMQKQEESSSQTRDSIPFDDIMNSLNLTITGNLDDDYDTTIDRLDYEIYMAYTDEEEAYYQALKDQVEEEYNSSKRDSISYSSSYIASSVNRYMMLGAI